AQRPHGTVYPDPQSHIGQHGAQGRTRLGHPGRDHRDEPEGPLGTAGRLPHVRCTVHRGAARYDAAVGLWELYFDEGLRARPRPFGAFELLFVTFELLTARPRAARSSCELPL